MATPIDIIVKIHNLLIPYYVLDFMLASLYYVLKSAPPICTYLFESCTLQVRELELLTFLGCVVVVKNRRTGNLKDNFKTICQFAKVLSTVLFFWQSPLYALVYVGLCLCHFVFFPEPTYKGPQYITYFNEHTLNAELVRSPHVTWVLECYATWSPACVNFAEVFSELSAKYHLENNLRFGKIDVSRHPNVAKQYNISASSWSRQLPTVMLLKGGKEVVRRPAVDAKGNVTKYSFHMESVIQSFDLNNLHAELSKKKKKDKKNTETENGPATEPKSETDKKQD